MKYILTFILILSISVQLKAQIIPGPDYTSPVWVNGIAINMPLSYYDKQAKFKSVSGINYSVCTDTVKKGTVFNVSGCVQVDTLATGMSVVYQLIYTNMHGVVKTKYLVPNSTANSAAMAAVDDFNFSSLEISCLPLSIIYLKVIQNPGTTKPGKAIVSGTGEVKVIQ